MIVVVTGPPCAGKSTHVDDHRGPDDLVIDFDRVAHALGYPTTHVVFPDHQRNRAAKAAVAARSLLIKAALTDPDRFSQSHRTWLIDARPEPWQREAYTRAAAVFVDLDPGRDECLRRALASGRPPSTIDQINDWFAAAPAIDVAHLFESAATTQTDSAGSPPRAPRKTGEAR